MADVPLTHFAKPPWSLSGGGAGSLQKRIERAAAARLGERSESIGRTTASGADDAFFLPDRASVHRLSEHGSTRPLVVGDLVRDFSFSGTIQIRNPYLDPANSKPMGAEGSPHQTQLVAAPQHSGAACHLQQTLAENGTPWYVHLESYSSKLRSPRGIAFAFVATRNHFTYDRDSLLFNRTAPVIKLPEEASEDQHWELLGLLNSSAGCFWMKQVCHDKGSQSGTGGFMHDEWERFYELTGTKLQEFPLPQQLPLNLGQEIDALAQQSAKHNPSTIMDANVPTREVLDEARQRQEQLRERMIAL
ncbi:hypothetical protein [Streptomyces coelicoflavus]|uniref:hypothetical protein n=1 Tax=Streptomyces coelicoflavus TaxID=285562 RepID=UPI003638AD57